MDSVLWYRKKRRSGDFILLAAVYGAAYASVFLLLGMLGYIFFRGYGSFSLSFFTTVTSSVRETMGIAGNLVNTFYIIVLTLAMAVPLGVGAALYLNEYAGQTRGVRMIWFAIDILAGIPSVIFGLFGMVFFGNVLGLGYSLANGALTCALMVLPLVVGNTRTALEAVPDGYRQGALGLGATKIYMIRTILLPAAGNGILTGVILAVGRIAGESAALLFTAGSARFLWKQKAGIWESIAGFRDKIFTSGGTLTVELYLQMQKGEYGMAFAIACVLMGMIFLMNFLLKLVCANGKQ